MGFSSEGVPLIRRIRSTAGFTIVELLVSVAIVGILAAVAVPALGNALAKSKQNEARSNLSSIYDLEKAYHNEFKTYATLLRIGFVPEGANRYSYCAGDPSVAGACVQSATDQFDFGSGNGSVQGPAAGTGGGSTGGNPPPEVVPTLGPAGPIDPTIASRERGAPPSSAPPAPTTPRAPPGGRSPRGASAPAPSAPAPSTPSAPSGSAGPSGSTGGSGLGGLVGGGTPTGGTTAGGVAVGRGGATGSGTGHTVGGGSPIDPVIIPQDGAGSLATEPGYGGRGNSAGRSARGGMGGGASGMGTTGGLGIAGNPHVSAGDFEADAYGRISSKLAPFDVDMWLIDDRKNLTNYISGF